MNLMFDTVHTDPLPPLLRAIGARDRYGRRSYRMTWGELSWRNGFALELARFSEHYSLIVGVWVVAYVRLPWLQRWHREPAEIMDSWGLSYRDNNLRFNWGAHSKGFQMPWCNWEQTAHDVRRADGSWVPYVGSWEMDKEPDGRLEDTFDYRYLLQSGEVQERKATIYVERRTRKLKWLRRLPFGRTTYAIDVRFSDEVGERSGSWKGGTIGCGYELRADETPRECLKRMERDRKF